MAQPTPYDRQANFSNFEALNPTAPKPGASLDAEFNAVKITSDQISANLALIQRDDGALASGVVGQDQLSTALSIGFTLRGAWAAPENYVIGDGVTFDSAFYRAKSSHLSVVGQNPSLATTLWERLVDFTDLAPAFVPDGSITSAKIADGAIATGDIADSAITSAKIADSAITSAKIADSAITSAKIADGTIATGDIADSAITSAKIADANVTTAKVADSAITSAKLSVVLGAPVNIGLAASVASNALTITLTDASGATPSASLPAVIPFRSATAATGSMLARSVTAATSLVISSGSTMGFTSAVAGKLWIVAFDDAGAVRLGAINCRNGINVTPLSPSGLASSTAEGGAGAADSAGVFYTGTAVTTKAYTVLGSMEWSAGLTTAGTWAIVPTKIEPYFVGMKMPGDRVQRARTTYVTYSSTATTGAFGDNKMQITEGAEYINIPITPSSAANVLNVSARAHVAPSGAAAIQIGLFQDSTAAALTHTIDTSNVADVVRALDAEIDLVAATTSSTTMRLRAASSSGTTYINGSSVGRRGGGALISHLQVEEIAA